MIGSVCVYCGSSPGVDPGFREEAAALGRALAERGQTLVYGGAHVGLMGVVADAALAAGGRVIGVIPASLRSRELAHAGLTELVVTASMHERKQIMAERADAFVALPGGLGTLDELFEIWTWSQLGLHAKPIGLVNRAGYYDGLITFLERAEAEGFVRAADRARVRVAPSSAALLDALS